MKGMREIFILNLNGRNSPVKSLYINLRPETEMVYHKRQRKVINRQ